MTVLDPDDIRLGPSIQFHHQPDGTSVSPAQPSQLHCQDGRAVSGTRAWTINPAFTEMTTVTSPAECGQITVNLIPA